MAARFRKGARVRLSLEGQESDIYKDLGLVETREMRVVETSMSKADHPGYDPDVGGGLYDLVYTDDGTPVPCSLYDWELRSA